MASGHHFILFLIPMWPFSFLCPYSMRHALTVLEYTFLSLWFRVHDFVFCPLLSSSRFLVFLYNFKLLLHSGLMVVYKSFVLFRVAVQLVSPRTITAVGLLSELLANLMTKILHTNWLRAISSETRMVAGLGAKFGRSRWNKDSCWPWSKVWQK